MAGINSHPYNGKGENAAYQKTTSYDIMGFPLSFLGRTKQVTVNLHPTSSNDTKEHFGSWIGSVM
jgi:hypothetical protein